ncbi:hypothetical protein [Caproiciproducens sp. MSJ-32]|uniref:hypothetical protein n=1 Tax=Caproiciproducens sp. MSJ-32 TaxID=2841527 RepID=UPI001C126A1D|nr:hypothetical protein [Caproiciproducens sp. MSJ-32]MBU5455398.1 hypothetical protein [Caproiciproducens sp. MSJ-32]
MKKVNPLEGIEKGTIGNYISRFENNQLYSSFYLKEDLEKIEYLLRKSTLEMKAMKVKLSGQPFVSLLFKFAGNNKYIYGRLYNTLDEKDKEHLEVLLFQREIPISFVDIDNNIIKTVMVENDFKDYLKKVFIAKNIETIQIAKDHNEEYNLGQLWREIL